MIFRYEKSFQFSFYEVLSLQLQAKVRERGIEPRIRLNDGLVCDAHRRRGGNYGSSALCN